MLVEEFGLHIRSTGSDGSLSHRSQPVTESWTQFHGHNQHASYSGGGGMRVTVPCVHSGSRNLCLGSVACVWSGLSFDSGQEVETVPTEPLGLGFGKGLMSAGCRVVLRLSECPEGGLRPCYGVFLQNVGCSVPRLCGTPASSCISWAAGKAFTTSCYSLQLRVPQGWLMGREHDRPLDTSSPSHMAAIGDTRTRAFTGYVLWVRVGRRGERDR